MALTQVSSKGIKNATLLDEDVNASANIAGSKLADNSISLAKLLHGDSNNNGKFLRANNGADPTFETITVPASINNLVEDTSPQLGGALDTNSKNIDFNDSTGASVNRARFGDSADLQIYHQNNVSNIHENGTGPLRLSTDEFQLMNSAQNKTMIYAAQNLAVSLNYNGNTKIQTLDIGAQITGGLGVNKSPICALDIQSATNENGLNLNCIGTPANYFLNVRDDNVSKFYIKSDGKVGVGTDAPSTTLSVINDSADEGINVKHSNLTKGVNIGFEKIQTVGTASDITLDIQAKGPSANLRCGINGEHVFGAQQDSRDFRIYSNKNGWSTLQMDADGGITGPIRRHVRRMNNGANSVATRNVFRLRRHNWGSGFFEVRMYASYYSGSYLRRFRINGHGAGGNSYSVLTMDDNFTNGSGADWGVGCQIANASASSPGDSTTYYCDVQVTIPNYWYGICELIMSSGYQTNEASSGGSMASNSYTLFS